MLIRHPDGIIVGGLFVFPTHFRVVVDANNGERGVMSSCRTVDDDHCLAVTAARTDLEAAKSCKEHQEEGTATLHICHSQRINRC